MSNPWSARSLPSQTRGPGRVPGRSIVTFSSSTSSTYSTEIMPSSCLVIAFFMSVTDATITPSLSFLLLQSFGVMAFVGAWNMGWTPICECDRSSLPRDKRSCSSPCSSGTQFLARALDPCLVDRLPLVVVTSPFAIGTVRLRLDLDRRRANGGRRRRLPARAVARAQSARTLSGQGFAHRSGRRRRRSVGCLRSSSPRDCSTASTESKTLMATVLDEQVEVGHELGLALLLRLRGERLGLARRRREPCAPRRPRPARDPRPEQASLHRSDRRRGPGGQDARPSSAVSRRRRRGSRRRRRGHARPVTTACSAAILAARFLAAAASSSRRRRARQHLLQFLDRFAARRALAQAALRSNSAAASRHGRLASGDARSPPAYAAPRAATSR